MWCEGGRCLQLGLATRACCCGPRGRGTIGCWRLVGALTHRSSFPDSVSLGSWLVASRSDWTSSSLQARPQPRRRPPPQAHRIVGACEGFQHVPVLFHAATKALRELLVLASFCDVLVDLGSNLVSEPPITGQEAEATKRPLRVHQQLGRLVTVAGGTPRPQLFGDLQGAEDLQFF